MTQNRRKPPVPTIIWGQNNNVCVVEREREKEVERFVASDPLGVYLFHTHSPKTHVKMQEHSH